MALKDQKPFGKGCFRKSRVRFEQLSISNVSQLCSEFRQVPQDVMVTEDVLCHSDQPWLTSQKDIPVCLKDEEDTRRRKTLDGGGHWKHVGGCAGVNIHCPEQHWVWKGPALKPEIRVASPKQQFHLFMCVHLPDIYFSNLELFF